MSASGPGRGACRVAGAGVRGDLRCLDWRKAGSHPHSPPPQAPPTGLLLAPPPGTGRLPGATPVMPALRAGAVETGLAGLLVAGSGERGRRRPAPCLPRPCGRPRSPCSEAEGTGGVFPVAGEGRHNSSHPAPCGDKAGEGSNAMGWLPSRRRGCRLRGKGDAAGAGAGAGAGLRAPSARCWGGDRGPQQVGGLPGNPTSAVSAPTCPGCFRIAPRSPGGMASCRHRKEEMSPGDCKHRDTSVQVVKGLFPE